MYLKIYNIIIKVIIDIHIALFFEVTQNAETKSFEPAKTSLYVGSVKETVLHGFLVIMKRALQNY